MKKKSPKEQRVKDHSIPSQFFISNDRNAGAKSGKEFSDAVMHHKSAHVYDESRFSEPPRTMTHWSVVWSDLMMTMFILFVVMFVYLSFNKDFMKQDGLGEGTGMNVGTGELDMGGTGREGDNVVTGNDAMTKIFDVSRHTLKKEVEDSFASVELSEDKTIRIILTGDLLFDLGKADLREEAKVSLGKIGALLGQNQYMINISGHTDNLPIKTKDFPSNWELSLIRASRVARFLIDEVGLPQKRFYVTGHGSNKPVKPNNTRKNRTANRRVELIITKEIPEPFQSAF